MNEREGGEKMAEQNKMLRINNKKYKIKSFKTFVCILFLIKEFENLLTPEFFISFKSSNIAEHRLYVSYAF